MSPPNRLTLDSLDTPCLILDRDRLDTNIARMRQRVADLGVALRPHLKTTKSVDIARRVVPNGAAITVSTLREAEYFASHGFRDLFYAVAIAPQKLARVAALIRAGARVLLAVDDPQVAASVSRAGAQLGVSFEVMIEIDSGEARSGVAADSDRLAQIVEALTTGARIAGVFTHGGHSYSGRSAADHARVAEEERVAVTAAAARLRTWAHQNLIVSMGSTPSVRFARHLQGVTEVRAGVYMLCDLFQAGVGVCERGDLALSVLATVIGRHPQRNQLVLDTGSLALSKDRSTQALGPAGDCGYGLLSDARSGQILEGMYLQTLYQEHGMVRSHAPIDFDAFPVGRRVRVLMNHVCMTAAAFDRYHVVRSGGEVIEEVWMRVNGW